MYNVCHSDSTTSKLNPVNEFIYHDLRDSRGAPSKTAALNATKTSDSEAQGSCRSVAEGLLQISHYEFLLFSC